MNINGCWKKVDVKIDHEITISFHTGPHCSYEVKGDVQHMAQHVAKWSEFSIHTFITCNIVEAMKIIKQNAMVFNDISNINSVLEIG